MDLRDMSFDLFILFSLRPSLSLRAISCAYLYSPVIDPIQLVYGMKQRSNFILLQVKIYLSLHHFLKRQFFVFSNGIGTLVKYQLAMNCMGLFLDPSFYSISLYVCPYAMSSQFYLILDWEMALKFFYFAFNSTVQPLAW